MESVCIGKDKGGEWGGKDLKRAVLVSLLIHTLLFFALFHFRGSEPLPGLIEVDIVMGGGIGEGEGAAPMSAVETESSKAQKKAIVRKPLRYVKTEAPLVEKRTVPPVKAAKIIQPQEQLLQQSMRALPITQVTSESSTPSRESIPFTNANYQVVVPLSTGGFSGERGGGAGEEGVRKGSAHRFRSMVLRKIEAAKIYPERARRRGIEGDAFVDFTVLPNGTVDGVEVTNGTRCHTLLKRAAVKTIQQAAPYLPLPATIKNENGVRMKVKISFHLS
ncbi:MAG: energy transducer TonB [Deltaproteobacteria bacterium]|nr:energy transducer TonB [Deltaproteobacteria bacterium]